MDNLRGNNLIDINNNQNIKFQLVDWVSSNEIVEYESDSDSEEKKNEYEDKKEYIIRAFGVTSKGTSICMNILDFPPHYYVNIPENWSKFNVDMFINFLKSKLPKFLRNSITKHVIVKRKKFRGFTDNKLFNFVRIYFKNTDVMNSSIRLLSKKLKIPGLTKEDKKFDLYESNIIPFIRFIHMQELLPAGWIELIPNSYEINLDRNSNCQIDINVTWKKVKMFETESMAPLIIASFDIECDSSHGDFPLAKKTYKKLGSDIWDRFHKILENIKKTKHTNKELSKKLSKKIENKAKYISSLIALGFDKTTNDENINYVYTKRNEKPDPEIYDELAYKTLVLLETPESYKQLAIDIISYFHFDMLDDDNVNTLPAFMNDSKYILELINDSFAENEEFKICNSIRKIYTKGNNKPTKSMVEKASKLMMKIYIRMFKQILDLLDEPTKHEIELIAYILSNFKDICESVDSNDFLNSILLKYLTDNHYEMELADLTDLCNDMFKFVNLSVAQMSSSLSDILPDIDSSRDVTIQKITTLFDSVLPANEGDKVIQIGTTIQRYGEKEPFLKHMVSLNTCDDIDGCYVESFQDEKKLLISWAKFMNKLDPDIVTGYNIFGFDFAYLFNRAEELDCVDQFAILGRMKEIPSLLECKTLSSSALGENHFYYLTMHGRVQMDLLKLVQRDHNLVSYKLDYVAETFINDSIIEINDNTIKIKGDISLNVGNYMSINYINNKGDEVKYLDGKKIKILDKKNGMLTLDHNFKNNEILQTKATWQLAKDDVSPQDIFRLQKGSSKDRQTVAIYCIQDCALCLHLINKLDIITNNIGMANVCTVPLSYIFLRGQGVKIFSLVSKQCRLDNFLVPLIKYQKEEIKFKNPKYDYSIEDQVEDKDGGYEGAIVLKPNPGIYLESSVVVLDYASLYPSSMISENLSHDSIVLDSKYLGDSGAKEIKKIGYDFVDITHDVYKWIDPNILSKGKIKTGTKTCRFVQFPDDYKGVIPRILQHLLNARKSTRKKIKFKTVKTKDGNSFSGLLDKGDILKVTLASGVIINIDKENVDTIEDS